MRAQVPRIKPKTVVALEEELLGLSWEEMDTTSKEWGVMGRALYRRAKCAPAPRFRTLHACTPSAERATCAAGQWALLLLVRCCCSFV